MLIASWFLNGSLLEEWMDDCWKEREGRRWKVDEILFDDCGAKVVILGKAPLRHLAVKITSFAPTALKADLCQQKTCAILLGKPCHYSHDCFVWGGGWGIFVQTICTNMALTISSLACPQNHRCPIIQVCPVGAISQNGYGLPVINESLCTECGKCVKNCPMRAVIKRN